MAFVPAPNIVMAEVRCTRNGQNIENRFMINNLSPVDAGALQEIATDVWDWAELVYFPLLVDQVHLREVVTTDLSEQNGEQYTYAPDATTNGVLTGTNLPNEVSLCVSLRSTSRGRSARGRMYFLSIDAEQMADSNNVTNTFATAAAAAVQNLIAAMVTAGRQLTIVSYFTNNAPRVGGPVYFPVTTAVVVDTVVDSMRRRKPGVGA